MKRQSKNPLKPIGGSFTSTARARNEACRKAGHPTIFVNCSKSTIALEVRRCYCGYKEVTVPEVEKGRA